MPVKNRILLYVIVGIVLLGSLSSMFTNIKSTFFPEEKTYSIEAVKLMIKHDRIREENKELKIENQVIEKDNEKLIQDTGADSTIIHNSSRAYRDSIRASIFK